ncbi:EexN family lipoprotein [Salinicola corii]|uniref:EexN family lipoprotein n=1 Tax=Salinicola corii TaxID=2606937 RepID=A0A640W6T7_9GAMM|nr:EexN family lipoprotein [Salinicola corii]KAA0015083.1 EexN family lipoprotein [Salinicola corii]
MKQVIPLLLVMLLAGCSPSEAPRQDDVRTVEELANNPERLKELRRQCKTERAELGDVLCNRVAEATRKRFYDDGETPYTPPDASPEF